jgi:hypothetical protein
MPRFIAILVLSDIIIHPAPCISALRVLESWRFVLAAAVYEDISKPIARAISFKDRASSLLLGRRARRVSGFMAILYRYR